MNKSDFCFDILHKAYLLTNDITPKKYDCGILCGSACCKDLSLSNIEETGMLLLPYEKEYLIKNGANESFFRESDGENFYICNTTCNRNLRSLSCRIFPYYPKIINDKIKIIKDIRAVSFCPLLSRRAAKRPNVYFLRAIKRAVRILVKNKDYYDEFVKTSDFLNCLCEMYSRFM